MGVFIMRNYLYPFPSCESRHDGHDVHFWRFHCQVIRMSYLSLELGPWDLWANKDSVVFLKGFFLQILG